MRVRSPVVTDPPPVELPTPYIETELVSIDAVSDIELLMYADLFEMPIEVLVGDEVPIDGI